jgi:hypothetical protein
VLHATAYDTVLGVVSGIVEWCLLVAALHRLPAHLYGAVCGRLVVGGDFGGDTAPLLEHAPK